MKPDSTALPLIRFRLCCAALPMMASMHTKDSSHFRFLRQGEHSQVRTRAARVTRFGDAARGAWRRACLSAIAGCGLLLAGHSAPAAQASSPSSRDSNSASLQCPSDQPLSLPCLEQQAQIIEHGMQMLYQSLQRQLPQASAQALQTEQDAWTRERDQRCQPNGYVHEAEDMAACRIGMALSRIQVYKNQWHPLAWGAQGERQP